MANCKEKNLLNEITYLTRLIGQHKKTQASLSRTWAAPSIDKSRINYQNRKTVSHPYANTSKPSGVVSYKYVKPCVKSSNLNWSRSQVQMPKKSIYTDLKCKEGSASKQQSNSDPKFSTCFVDAKESSVHINPHFNQEKSTKIVKVHVNPNFPVFSETEDLTGEKLTKKPEVTSSPEEKLKVHLNPNFCKLMPDNSPHTQLRTLMSSKVHVNPKLVEKVLKEKNDSESFDSKKSACSDMKLTGPLHTGIRPNESAVANKIFYSGACGKSALPGGENRVVSTPTNSRKGEFLSLGKRKLVRVGSKVAKPGGDMKHRDKLKSPRNDYVVSKHKLHAVCSPSESMKKARAITSKYKLIKVHSTSSLSVAVKSAPRNKYKIDRRSPSAKSSHSYVKPRENYQVMSRLKKSNFTKVSPKQMRLVTNSTRSLSGNMVWRTWNLQAKVFKTTNRKLYRIGSSPSLRRKNDVGKNATLNTSLVRIGGVLYKSSRNKLTRSNPRAPADGGKLNSHASLKKKGKTGSKGQVLFIRGQKFVMDKQGKTLKRLSSSDSMGPNKHSVSSLYSFRRVDIGGVTFVQKSSDLLMRTNTHKARSLLSHAKQKSISTLMKKLKKNNQPCMFFQKFGRCFRLEKGTCPCVHDRKHIAVCKRFLQAKCNLEGCLLSHEVVPEKMPTCKYFLDGCCNRVNCPYLHVKVNEKAEICTSFLQGYCSNGNRCKKRHVHICPEFEKNGRCIKGKHCPYPHKAKRQKKNLSRKRGMSPKMTSPQNEVFVEARNVKSNSSNKTELTRYYLAPRKAIGEVDDDASRHLELIECKEMTEKCIEPCGAEVSSTRDSVHVVASGDIKPTSFKRIMKRDQIGTLPSFIPL